MLHFHSSPPVHSGERLSFLVASPLPLSHRPSSPSCYFVPPFPAAVYPLPHVARLFLLLPLLPPLLLHTSLHRRTPCIRLAQSAMARMTAVATLLPGLLVAAVLGTAIAVITRMTANGVAAYRQHTLALNVPLHSLHTLSRDANHLHLLYSAITTLTTTLMALLWGMGVTHTQVRAWVHQQGLAVTAGLKSASKFVLQLPCSSLFFLYFLVFSQGCTCNFSHLISQCFLFNVSCHVHPRAAITPFVLPSLHSCCHHSIRAAITPFVLPSLHLCCHHSIRAAIIPFVLPSFHSCCHHSMCIRAAICRTRVTSTMLGWMRRVGEAVATVMASMVGAHEWKEAMEMRVSALGMQLEETRRELAAARREVIAVKGEFAAVKDETEAGMRGLGVQLEETGKELAAARGEVAAVKEEFVAVKDETEAGIRGLGVQLEETRREVAEVERRRTVEMREMRGQVEERERELTAELAAVKVELATIQGAVAEHKQSSALQLEEAERRRVSEMRGQVEERERELAAVKAELAAHKEDMKEKWDVAERKRQSDLRELTEEARKKEDEMRKELAREREERRTEVQDVETRGAAELREQVEKREGELAALKRELAEKKRILDALMTLDALQKLIQSDDDQETAWKVSAE
ncbi:unnamed protein product [Closterium sp. NIES-65]|nr:unnamed protein product [Closterium sp. NIES-65]